MSFQSLFHPLVQFTNNFLSENKNLQTNEWTRKREKKYNNNKTITKIFISITKTYNIAATHMAKYECGSRFYDLLRLLLSLYYCFCMLLLNISEWSTCYIFYAHTYGVWDAEMSECLHIISIKIRIEPATKTEREIEEKGNINNNKNAIKLSENGKKINQNINWSYNNSRK